MSAVFTRAQEAHLREIMREAMAAHEDASETRSREMFGRVRELVRQVVIEELAEGGALRSHLFAQTALSGASLTVRDAGASPDGD